MVGWSAQHNEEKSIFVNLLSSRPKYSASRLASRKYYFTSIVRGVLGEDNDGGEEQ